ncbi:MAG: hypothetical protein C5S33_04225 [ANME-2 cluster archaeon]|jgi:hypothetical protein|nr:hypothetical protein [ANME-2 cluster archaeon]
MDYKERQEITANKEITTMRLLGMSISFMTILLTFLLSLTQIDNNSIITIVSVFILGLTLVLSYISIGTKIENSAGEITSLIIVLTTLSNLSILVIPDLKIYFLVVLIPVIFVILYLFENNRLRKIFFLNIMTIIIIVKVVPLLLPQILPTIIEYIFK